jgi:hypothetical protein
MGVGHSKRPRQGRGEGLQVRLSTNGEWFNQACLCNKASRKPKGGFRELWEDAEIPGGGGVPEKAWKIHTPNCRPSSVPLSIWCSSVSFVIYFVINP